jgi:cell division protein FtsN
MILLNIALFIGIYMTAVNITTQKSLKLESHKKGLDYSKRQYDERVLEIKERTERQIKVYKKETETKKENKIK